MTHTETLALIADEIETLTANLLKVNAAIELIGKPAVLSATEIAKDLAAAKDRFATALADKASVEREERLKDFTDIRIVTSPGENLMNTTFTIFYTRMTWDNNAKESLPKEHKCTGFAALDDTAYEYLVTTKPHLIPAEITKLAPGNPHDAFGLYFIGKQRGHFKQAAA